VEALVADAEVVGDLVQDDALDLARHLPSRRADRSSAPADRDLGGTPA
jgi:hypothetical protein